MSLGFDQKEDIRLRMADLEQKLAKSEEERYKLEKTCNVLMRAFREEEKMHYKALNKKYEKFLEDCTVRKKRNEIILQSLCRIEDRARVVFAKTERLKLLKDHYVSHMNLSDLRNELNWPTWKTYSQKITAGSEVTSKSSDWNTTWISDFGKNYKFKKPSNLDENLFLKEKCFEGFDNDVHKTSKKSFYKSSSQDFYQEKAKQGLPLLTESERKTYEEGNSFTEVWRKTLDSPTKFQAAEVSLGRNNLLANQNPGHFTEFTTEKNNDLDVSKKLLGRDVCKDENLDDKSQAKNLKEVSALREKGVFKHQESIEKLKKALSVEGEEVKEEDQNDSEKSSFQTNTKYKETKPTFYSVKDEIEMNESVTLVTKVRSDGKILPEVVEDNLNHESGFSCSPKISSVNQFSVENNNVINQGKGNQLQFRSENFNLEENSAGNNLEKEKEFLPMGLDGVDYQNETYPESYYEQPVHQHNYSSLASDVILEEDESDQDLDQPEPSSEKNLNHTGSLNEAHARHSVFDRNENKQLRCNSSPERRPQSPDKEKCLSSDSEKSLEREQFKAVEVDHSTVNLNEPETSDRSNRNSKTNVTRSNLVHLLESDSESFQIEHGDKVSTNDDSDFDFSFHQN